MKASTMQRLRIITISILVLLLILFFIGSVMLSIRSNEYSANRADLIINLNRFMDGSAYLTSEVRAYAATGDIEHFDNYWEEVNTLKNRDIGVENMQSIGIADDEIATIKEMQSISNNLIPLESAAMDSVNEGNSQEAMESVFGEEYESGLAQIATLQVELHEKIDTRTHQLVANAIFQNTLIFAAMAIVLLLIMVVQIVSEVIIKNSLIKPIADCSNALHEISKGNLTYNLGLKAGKNEIGVLVGSTKEMVSNVSGIINELSDGLTAMSQGDFTHKQISGQLFVGDYAPLATAYNKINKELPATLKELQNSSNLVRGGSEQLANNAQAMSQGANSQSSAIKMLTVSVDEVSERIKQTAEDAREVKKANTATQESLQLSNEQMQDMMRAMEQINEKSHEISDIIKAIDDIAFQTNILSLNAAVEAARAGVSGKGFAVVADEVRSLASRSAKSARDTATLIEETLSAVKQGNKVAKSTSASILNIFEGASKLSTLVDDIASATESQAVSAEQIKAGVEQIASVVDINTSAAEQTASVSEELLSQAHTLKTMTSRFTFSG